MCGCICDVCVCVFYDVCVGLFSRRYRVLAHEGSARIGVEDLHDNMRVGVFVVCVCVFHDMRGCICVCIHMCVDTHVCAYTCVWIHV